MERKQRTDWKWVGEGSMEMLQQEIPEIDYWNWSDAWTNSFKKVLHQNLSVCLFSCSNNILV